MKAITRIGIVALAAAAFVIAAPEASAQGVVTVTVDYNQMHQTIDGFGAAQPRLGPGLGGDMGGNDPAHRMATHLLAPSIMDLAFSSLNGIGMSILRMKITAALELSDGNWNYVNDPDSVWVMQQAAARGPVKILASVWSPPSWMKSNGSVLAGRCSNDITRGCSHDYDPDPVNGGGCLGAGSTCVIGSLNLNAYQKFADYLLHYVREFANTWGIKIYALSMANEPEAQVVWDGNAWYGASIASFLRYYLAPTFAADPSVTTKVVAPESARWDHTTYLAPEDPFYTGPYWNTPQHPLSPTTLLGPTINDSTALARVDIVAGHQYGDPQTLSYPLPSALIGPLASKPTHSDERRVWQTEYSGTNVLDIAGAVYWAKRIHQSLIGYERVSAWIYFILFEPGSLIGTNGSDFFANKGLWALGHFSKYVRPGFVRIGASSTSSNLLVTAFKDPAMGQMVVVAINDSASSKVVQINITNPTISSIATPYITSSAQDMAQLADIALPGTTQLVPAMSIVTFVAYPPNRTSDILWRKTDGSTMVWLSGIASTANYPGAKPSNWQTKGIGDFDGNGRGDILWRDQVNGINTFYYNGTAASQGSPGNLPSDWSISGVGDFLGLTRSDILWRNADGWVAIWQDGTNTTTWLSALGPEWQIQGVGDFVGTSKADILWRCVSQAPCGAAPSGSVAIWQDGTTATTWPGARGLDWQIHGVGDFWGDGRSDIFWRQPSTGWTSIWHNGTNYDTTPGLAGGDWPVQAVGDYDGDGKSDILYRHNTAGTMHVWLAANPSTALTPENPGALWQVVGAGRFDR